MINVTPKSCRIVDQITTAKDKKFEPVARMADAIIDAQLEKGNCLPQDLRAKGFTRQDIIALWHFANALASVELKGLAGATVSSFVREVRYA